MKAMPRHRSHSIEFKRQVAQEFVAGETLHGLAKRHDISRNLIRLWVARFEAGAYDDDARAADLIQEYEAKIAALERMVGRQALEIEFLKGALKNAPRPRAATTSVIAGPVACPSRKDVG
jgi:transposase